MNTVKTTVEIDGKVSEVRVASATRPKLTHKVVLSCSCEGFQFNGFCYHLVSAAGVLREDRRAQALRTRARLGR